MIIHFSETALVEFSSTLRSLLIRQIPGEFHFAVNRMNHLKLPSKGIHSVQISSTICCWTHAQFRYSTRARIANMHSVLTVLIGQQPFSKCSLKTENWTSCFLTAAPILNAFGTLTRIISERWEKRVLEYWAGLTPDGNMGCSFPEGNEHSGQMGNKDVPSVQACDRFWLDVYFSLEIATG